MIQFFDLKNDAHHAQATIKRSSGVNGSLSLSGEIISGDEVLTKLDYGWRLKFDDEKYVVSYKKLNNKTKSIEFDAVQEFFWDFSKVALHEELTGSHTFENYLQTLFANTNYTYNLDVEVAAFEQENWGYKNKLSLFNDIISTAGVEFEVHNEIVHITDQIGNDLTTIARAGINLSDLTEEMQISNFATYGKGYGAFVDSEDHSKGRLEVEYRSDLAKTYGDLEADPVVDERYTVKANLIAKVKETVDATYSVSVSLNLYDLKSAGYANYESPQTGDFLMAIDDSLNFKRQIRIIKLEETFTTTGKLIGYTATCGDLTAAEQYQAALGGVSSQISKIQKTVDSVELAANGKSKIYRGDTEPATANDGDLYFDTTSSDPDDWVIKQWVNGRWEQITLAKNEVTDQIEKATADIPELKAKIADSLAKADAANAQFNESISQITDLSATVEGVKTDAANAATQANQAVTDASTAKADATAAKGQASNAIGQAGIAIGNAADALNKINSMSVGGRNYIISSKLVSYVPYNTKPIATNGGKTITTTYVSETSTYLTIGISGFKPIGQYTMSGKMTINGTPVTSATFNGKGVSTYNAPYTATDTRKIDDNGHFVFAETYQGRDSWLMYTPITGIKAGDVVVIEGLKFETGNVATDWSAAPEDVQIQIDNVNGELSQKVSQTTYNTLAGTVDTVSTIAKQNQSTIGTLATKTSVDTVNKTATTAQTLAQQNANELLNKASTNTVDTLTQRVTTAESTLSQTATKAELALTNTDVDKLNDTVASQALDITATADGLKLKADSSTVSDLDGRVTSLSGQLDIQAGLVAAKVTASDVTGMLNGYATQSWSQGQISAAKNEISASVETVNKRVNNLQVGGRNLIHDTSFEQGLWSTAWNKPSMSITADGNLKFIIPDTNQAGIGVSAEVLEMDKIYTLTAKVRGLGEFQPYIMYGGDIGNFGLYDSNGVPYPMINSATDFVDIKYTFTLKGKDPMKQYAFAVLTAGAVGNWLEIKKDSLKLEAGNVSTAWTAALEDMATIDWTKAQLDIKDGKISAAVTSLKSDITNATADMATQTWTQGELELTASGFKTQISSVKDGLTKQYTQLQQTLDGVQVTANNAVTQGQLTLLSNQFTSTISGIQVGGTNLLTGTQNWQGEWGNLSLWPVPVGEETYAGLTVRNRSISWWGLGQYYDAKPNTTYTFSFYAKASEAGNFLEIFTLDKEDWSSPVVSVPVFANRAITTDWQRYSITFTTKSGGKIYPSVCSNKGGITIYVAGYKLEKGSLATDWSLAPEDQATVSQFTQLQKDINLRVKTGDLINQINISPEGILIDGNHVHITGATTIDNAAIKSAAIDSLSADKLTAGTIDATKINVIGINANNITTGSITGANLSINLNTGRVSFNKGRISSSDNSLDINIDEGYIALTNNYDHSVLIKNGQLQFTQPNVFDPTQGEPYMSISNSMVGNGLHGASLLGRDYVAMSTNENMTSNLFGVDSIMGEQPFAGFGVGKNYKTVIGGANRGVFISGGQQINNSDALHPSPSISIGTDAQGVNSGNRIVLKGEYVHAMAVQYQTTSGSSNVFVAADGALVRVTSALKYKDQVERTYDDSIAEKLITLPTATWMDKAEMARYNNDPVNQPVPERHFGMIAEDLAAAGIEELVVRNNGELEGIEYDRIGPALVPLIRKLYDRVEKLEELQNAN